MEKIKLNKTECFSLLVSNRSSIARFLNKPATVFRKL